MSGTRPVDEVPSWATDDNYTSGVQAGQTTRNEPSAGQKSQGFIPDTVVAARRANWLLGSICDYIEYLQMMPLVNWQSATNPGLSTPNDGPLRLLLATDLQHIFVTANKVDGSSLILRNTIAKLSSNNSTNLVYNSLFNAGISAGDGGAQLQTDTLVAIATDTNQWVDVTPSGLGSVGTATTHYSMCFGEDVVLFSGAGSAISNNIRRSTNYGTSWSTVACHTGAGGYRDIAYDGVNFFATPVTAGSFKVGKSASGASWSTAGVGALVGGDFPTTILLRIRAGLPGNLVVWSHNDWNDIRTINYSTDSGATWIESGSVDPTAVLGIVDVQYSSLNDHWFALMKNGEFNMSADSGASWVRIGDTGLTISTGLQVDGGSIVAFGYMTGPAAAVSISIDQGVSWSIIRLGQTGDPYPNIDYYPYAAYSGGFYVGVGGATDEARIYYSQRTRP